MLESDSDGNDSSGKARKESAVTMKPRFAGRACWVALGENADVFSGDIGALVFIPEIGLVLTNDPKEGRFICWVVVGSKNNTSLEHVDLRKSEAVSSALVMLVGVTDLKDDHERGELIWKEGQLLGVSLGGTKAFVWMSSAEGRPLH